MTALAQIEEPTLQELPKPSPGLQGWPWTIAPAKLPTKRPDGSPWPRISIVTPSFNQGRFIEETLRSILLQGYPNLEYIVVDGGSTDETISILERYRPWLSRCVVEPDTGQPNAINKGLLLATGEIWNWINSDDYLLPGALADIGSRYRESSRDIVAVNVLNFLDGGQELPTLIQNSNVSAIGLVSGLHETSFHQPGLWFNAERFRAIGALSETLQYTFDWHFLVRYLDRWPQVDYGASPQVMFRLHQQSKTIALQERFHEERNVALRQLERDQLTPATLSACRSRLDRHEWTVYLGEQRSLVASRQKSRTLALAEILWRILQSPARRMNSLTVGAVRRILARV